MRADNPTTETRLARLSWLQVLLVSTGLLVGTVLIVAPVLGFAAPAQAHSYLIASTPEAGSTIAELPQQFSVTSNEALLDISGDGTGFALQVTDADGLFYGDGCVTVEGASMSTPASLGEAGTYLVQWQIISADGHPISDQFTFDWQPAESVTLSEGSAAAPDCGGNADTGTAVEGADDSNGEDGNNGSVDPVTAAANNAATLSNVLWVGGILAAVTLAVLVTLGLLTRRPKA